jgi:prefoldin subunit 5
MSHGDGNETPNEEVVEVDDSYEERDKQISTLVEHEDILIENSEDLLKAFESFFETEYDFNDIGKLWTNVNLVIKPEFDDIDELADTANAFINIISNLDAEIVELLREEGGSEEIISLLRDLKLDHGYQLDRQFNKLQKGRNWWSNIKTNAGFRSQRPTFEHELTIDYTETVIFNSNIHSTFILIDHFTRQLQSVPKLVGDDALLEMNKDQIDTIIDRLEDLKSDIEDYEEEIESIGEETEESDSPEDSSTESEDQEGE